jgi:nucleoside-diphosphate-sugar epimerase
VRASAPHAPRPARQRLTYRAVVDRFVVFFEPTSSATRPCPRLARAFCHALDHFDEMQGQPYNVGLSDANLSKMELCREIQKQIPDFTVMEAPIGKDPDQRNYVVSNAKIEATGYKTQVSIQRAIAELIKGYQVVRRNQHAKSRFSTP